jgi:hypothetical protein
VFILDGSLFFPSFSENAFSDVICLRTLDVYMPDIPAIPAVRDLAGFIRRNRNWSI